jgi:hypothetical protein
VNKNQTITVDAWRKLWSQDDLRVNLRRFLSQVNHSVVRENVDEGHRSKFLKQHS